MIQKINTLFLLISIISVNVTAQRAVGICGEYIFYPPENISIEQARQIALERAKLAALANRFGTTISQINVTDLKNYNEKSETWFRRISSSEVKGVWLEDTRTPEYKIRYEQGMLAVEVSVCGNAREIVGAGIDFTAKVLRNGTRVDFESYDFIDGNDFYLWFRTPAEGYLAVYLTDDSGKAFCLLPHKGNQSGRAQVKANRDYIFFSKEHAEPAEKQMVTNLTLKCAETKPIEHNFLYIIFSPNEFTKANDTHSGNATSIPELSFEDFQKWLARNRQADKDMKVDMKALTIKRKN